MGNEYRYGRSPHIRRRFGSVLLAVLGLLGGLFAFSSVAGLISLAGTGLPSSVYVDLPLQRDDLDAIVGRWNGPVSVEPEYRSTLGATVTGLDERTTAQLLTVQIIDQIETLLIGLLIAVPAGLHLFGRLRWHVLGRAAIWGGAVAALGALGHSFFYGFAIVLARAQVSPDGPGMETAPFLGWDFAGVFVGGLFIVLGIAVNRVAHFAHQTDGTV